MTALVAFTRPDCVHILTDGLVENRAHHGAAIKDVIGATSHKVHPMPAHGAAYINVGSMLKGYCMRAALDAVGDLDAMRDRMPEEARGLRDQLDKDDRLSPSAEDATAHIIAGWSARDERFTIAALFDRDHEGVPAFHVLEMVAFSLPMIDAPALLTIERPADGVAYMQRQRAAFPAKIGGFCQLTTVTRHEAMTRILERWDDPVSVAA